MFELNTVYIVADSCRAKALDGALGKRTGTLGKRWRAIPASYSCHSPIEGAGYA
jgi:hypothetical protein